MNEQLEDVIKELLTLKLSIENARQQYSFQEEHIERLWGIIHSVQSEKQSAAITNHADFPSLARFFSKYWSDCLLLEERKSAQSILSSSGEVTAESYSSRFSYMRYDSRINELGLTGPAKFQGNFTMIGCGANPATFMTAYHHNTGFSAYIALDKDKQSVMFAKRAFAQKATIPLSNNILFLCMDAGDYDYSDTGFLFFALGITDKKRVIKRVAETLPCSSAFILRNPVLLGKLIYEDVLPLAFSYGYKIIANASITPHCMAYALQR